MQLKACFIIFRMEYLFNFDDKFEIHDDIEVLKKMGMVLGKCILNIELEWMKSYLFSGVHSKWNWQILKYFAGLDKGVCSAADLQKAKSMVPKSFESYVERK